MTEGRVLRKNRDFYIGMGGTVLDGLLSGGLFLLLYSVLQTLWRHEFDMGGALRLTGAVALLFLLRILVYSHAYTRGQIGGASVSMNIRLQLGDHLKRIPLSRFERKHTGDYVNTMTSDVNDYEKILTHKSSDLVRNLVLSAMLAAFAATVHVPSGIVLLAADLLLVPSLWLSFRMVGRYGKEKNDTCARSIGGIVEYITGIQTFRAYGMGGMRNRRVIDAMRDYSRVSFVYETRVIPIGSIFFLLNWLSCPLVIWTAGVPWAAGRLNSVPFLILCMLPVFSSKLANSIFIDATSYRNLLIARGKIIGLMDEPEEAVGAEPFLPLTHDIVFDRVDFSYLPGEPVLKQASFTVPDQGMTAIVGASGSGKSTIINLIAKFYEADSGMIRIGEKPIERVAAEEVFRHVSMVDQDVFLFDDTVRDNIRYARPEASDEEVEEACRQANCDGFIRNLDGGYDALVGENGNLLSGGERQRISIARAILKNSPILLLDEATASLDTENELAVKQAIVNLLRQEKTVVMVAHTLSMVRNADRILVVSDGRIAESGRHDDLLARGGVYADMWRAGQETSI